MKFKRKISKWGGSTGVTIPKDLLEYLDLDVGDNVSIEEITTIKNQKYMIIRKEDEDTISAEDL